MLSYFRPTDFIRFTPVTLRPKIRSAPQLELWLTCACICTALGCSGCRSHRLATTNSNWVRTNAGFCETQWSPLAPLGDLSPGPLQENYSSHPLGGEALPPVVAYTENSFPKAQGGPVRRISEGVVAKEQRTNLEEVGRVTSAGAVRVSHEVQSAAAVWAVGNAELESGESDFNYFQQ
jgi:hypothetical protein